MCVEGEGGIEQGVVLQAGVCGGGEGHRTGGGQVYRQVCVEGEGGIEQEMVLQAGVWEGRWSGLQAGVWGGGGWDRTRDGSTGRCVGREVVRSTGRCVGRGRRA